MRVISRPAVVALLLLFALTHTLAQQKRPAPPKVPSPQSPQPKVAPSPAPTFDTLVRAESYTIYGEVRGVGSVIRSSTVTEALEPILKLSGPPKEFKTIVKVASPPASVVARPLIGVTVISAVSLSVLVAATSAAFRPL